MAYFDIRNQHRKSYLNFKTTFVGSIDSDRWLAIDIFSEFSQCFKTVLAIYFLTGFRVFFEFRMRLLWAKNT